MNKESGVLFLFSIAKEIKRSYECPVILLTQKDYADNIHNSMISLRTAIIQQAPPQTVRDLVNTFHFDWLQAVQDVETLQKRAKDTPRESILKSIDYTLDCIKNRLKDFKLYFNHVNKSWTPTDKALMQDELEVIKGMQETDGCALFQKQAGLTNSADKAEFTVIVLDEIKELFNWVDRLYDCLALKVCKLLALPLLPAELSTALQQVIDEVACFVPSKAQMVITTLNQNITLPSRPIYTFKDNNITRIVEKIKKLEDRITHLRNENSSSELALRHKAIFLEDRLESLENLKLSLTFLKKKKCVNDEMCTSEEGELHIFNHLLPRQERCRLVEKLIRLWEQYIINPDNKSVVTIMQNDTTEVFRDDLGCFAVDKYGRKLHTKKGDQQVYQVDDTNMLIPANDDDHQVYFYAECGRYYLTDDRVKVNKAHQTASVFMLHRSGMLPKLKETVDGIQYQFDNLGRFYFGKYGDNICCDRDTIEKYRSDSLDNLVKIRNMEQYDFITCPVELMATECSMFLKKVVGAALRKCVAEVILMLPQDPIRYLADQLEKYHFEMEAKKKRLLEQQKLMAEQELVKSLNNEHKTEQYVEPEESYDDKPGIDCNFINYPASPL